MNKKVEKIILVIGSFVIGFFISIVIIGLFFSPTPIINLLYYSLGIATVCSILSLLFPNIAKKILAILTFFQP